MQSKSGFNLSWLKPDVHSLAFKFGLSICVLIIISMSTLAGFLLYHQSSQNQRFMNDFGQIIVKQLAASAKEPLFAQQYQELDILSKNVSIDHNVISTAIFSHTGEKIVSNGQLPPDNEIQFTEPFYTLGQTWRFDYQKEPVLIVHTSPISFNQVVAGYALVVFSQDSLYQQLKQQLVMMLSTAIVLLLIVMLAGLYLGQVLSKPISTLANVAKNMQAGKQPSVPVERRNDELGKLLDSINAMGEGLVQKDHVESMMSKFLSKDVAQKIINKIETVELAGEQVEATVLFADIVGFTSISEKISPEQVQQLLNEYYGYFNACARFYFGSVDKFIGDCVMVVFGAPDADDKHQFHAIACALLMQELAKQLNQRRQSQGLYPIELRIGINSGNMLAGILGSSARMEYTVVGDAVNLASRLCSEAEGAEVIIQQSLYQQVHSDYPMQVTEGKTIRVRGKEEPVQIFKVESIQHPYPVVMSNLIADILAKKID
ncbi:MAG: HAMP domain-containing protein [Pseudomonadales bacterium]|nr:HAMP domain-containing protein [Pseudomonadales bacterium]